MIPLILILGAVAGFAAYEVWLKKKAAAPAPPVTPHGAPPPGVLPPPPAPPAPPPVTPPSTPSSGGAVWAAGDPTVTSLGPGSYRSSGNMPVEMWGLASGVVKAGMQAAVSSGTYTSASAWGPADTPPADWPADDLGPNRVRTEFTVAQGKTGPFSSGGDPSTRLWHRVAMGVTLT